MVGLSRHEAGTGFGECSPYEQVKEVCVISIGNKSSLRMISGVLTSSTSGHCLEMALLFLWWQHGKDIGSDIHDTCLTPHSIVFSYTHVYNLVSLVHEKRKLTKRNN